MAALQTLQCSLKRLLHSIKLGYLVPLLRGGTWDGTKFVIYSSQYIGLVDKSDEVSIGVLKSSFTKLQAWQNCNLYVGVIINLFRHLAKDSYCSAFQMCLSFVQIDFSWNYAVLSYVFKLVSMPDSYQCFLKEI